MKKAFKVMLASYILLSGCYIILHVVALRHPLKGNIPSSPAMYLDDARKSELLEIADYMRSRDIERAHPSLEPTDSSLEEMLKNHRLSRIEFMDDDVIRFGAFRHRVWCNYYYGEGADLHVRRLKERFPDRTYFQIDDHWYFVSTSRVRQD